MITKREIQTFINMEPRFDDIMCSLRATAKQPKGMIRETKEVVALARKFNKEVVEPNAWLIDRKGQEDPGYVPRELVKKANEWGFYTLWIARAFGGKGYNMPSMSYFCEELGSACLGLANLIGVHYLGISSIMATWNTRLIQQICEQVIDGEKTSKPCLLSLAITEPSAGTDAEELELMDRGKFATHCRRVDGGYEVNGTKVFISNAAVSTWHVIIGYEDTQNPSTTCVFFLVKNGTPGFTVGRQEKKMGQKACPANELIFDNCFIPDDHVCINPSQMKDLSHTPDVIFMRMIDSIVSVTRAGVGAFGAGAARSAFETALAHASETRVAGKLLINHEWVQCRLAEMYKNVAVSRLLYVESNYASGLDGFFKLLQWKPLYYYYKYLPQYLVNKFVVPFMAKPVITRIMRVVMLDRAREELLCRTSGWASIAKFAGTDAGIRNCQMAIEIMGQKGLRHDGKVEKCLRDAKLLQIYEGTNQLNMVNTFKCLIKRCAPQAVLFDE